MMDRRLTGLDLKTSLSALADLAMPRECIVCGTALMPGERHICLCCRADLPRTDFRLLSRNPMSAKFNARIAASGDEGYVPYSYAIALYYYQAGYKEISQALKYRGNLAAGRGDALHFDREHPPGHRPVVPGQVEGRSR